MKCVLLDTASGRVVREQDFDEIPPALAAEKGLQWYELIDHVPDYDPDTHTRKPDGQTVDDTARTLTKHYRADPLPADAVQARLLKRYDKALTDFLDREAQSRRYDNRVTCALRAGYPGPFQAEGIAYATWMDDCNAKGYQIMGDVVAGTRPLPTVDAFLAEMPAMVWPA